MCGRGESQLTELKVPMRQNAHLVANRFSGIKNRYGGAKAQFTEEDWTALGDALGESFGLAESAGNVRLRIGKMTEEMCGECHEEVLSEPIYTPVALRALATVFRGRSRVERMITLAKVIELGSAALQEQLARDRADAE